MDTSKLTQADKIVLGSSIATIVFTFLSWFKYDTGIIGTVTAAGTKYTTGKLALIAALVMLAEVIANKIAGAELPKLPYGLIHLIAGGAAGLLVLLQFISGDSPADRAFGLFLALISSIALAYGGFLQFKERGNE